MRPARRKAGRVGLTGISWRGIGIETEKIGRFRYLVSRDAHRSTRSTSAGSIDRLGAAPVFRFHVDDERPPIRGGGVAEWDIGSVDSDRARSTDAWRAAEQPARGSRSRAADHGRPCPTGSSLMMIGFWPSAAGAGTVTTTEVASGGRFDDMALEAPVWPGSS